MREKLAVADAAAVTDAAFSRKRRGVEINSAGADLPATEIDVRLGASWLPPDDVKQFIHKLLNVSSGVEVGTSTRSALGT